MSTKIDFSPGESEILGLKVGRCNSDLVDETLLYQLILEGRYDICRLKIPAEDEMISCRLNNIGLPFFFSGSIRRYKTKITEKPSGSYNFPDLIFEMYDGSQDRLLRDMLVGTWGTYPIGYYRTPYLSTLLDKEKEIECVFQFYKKHNLNRNYPNNSIMFIKHGDAYVGFFALNILDGNLESHIGGILEPYRKSGYFLDKLRYIKEFCLHHHLEHFIFGARNENAEVQKIFQYVGFQGRGSENVFHIPSLLTFTQKPVSVEEFSLSDQSSDLYSKLYSSAQGHANTMLPGFKGVSFDLKKPETLGGKNKVKIVFSFPVITKNEVLLVMKEPDEQSSSILGYFRAFK